MGNQASFKCEKFPSSKLDSITYIFPLCALGYGDYILFPPTSVSLFNFFGFKISSFLLLLDMGDYILFAIHGLSFFNFVGFKLSSFLHLSPVSDPLLSRATATTCSFLSYMAIAMQSHRHTLPPPQSSLSPPLSHSFVHHHQ